MLKAAKAVPITPGMAEINGSLLSFRSTYGTDDSWYRCNYTLGEVQRCYDFKLKVQAEGPSLNLYRDQIFLFQGSMTKAWHCSDCASGIPSTPETISTEEKGEKAEKKAEEEEKVEKDVAAESRRVWPVAVSVVLLAALAASVAGFFLYRRSSRQTAEPRAEGNIAGLKVSFKVRRHRQLHHLLLSFHRPQDGQLCKLQDQGWVWPLCCQRSALFDDSFFPPCDPTGSMVINHNSIYQEIDNFPSMSTKIFFLFFFLIHFGSCHKWCNTVFCPLFAVL